MCGIWALFGCSSFEELTKMSRGLFRIRQRGPDAFSMLSVGNLDNSVLGFCRLEILDHLYGMQPIKVHQYPNLFLVYNGEIYNWEALGRKYGFKYETHCDTEVILHLIGTFGIERCVAELDGVFAFIMADVEHKKVYFARDTVGVRPLFVLEHELNTSTELKITGACSEAKGLLEMKEHCDGGTCVIKPHKPGHFSEYALLENGSLQFLRKQRFHTIGHFPAYDVTPIPETCDNVIREALTIAVDKRMMAERRIGCMLSGGLDSSLVTALVQQQMPAWGCTYQLETFAIGMSKDSTDLQAARRVAEYLGTNHHEVVSSTEEFLGAVEEVIKTIESFDVTTVRASVGMYLISKYISSNTDCKIVFSGEGADELCQGYIYFHKAPSAEEADRESHRLLNDLYLYDGLRADRTVSAHGLELRVPFLDHRFMAEFLRLPADQRCPRNRIEKYALRQAFHGTGLIPDSVLWRPKEAFSDGVSSVDKSWYQVLQHHIEGQISDQELARAALLYPENTPTTKEALHYRKIFSENFHHSDDLIPYYWMPKWTESVNDPSARVLKHYKSS